MGDDHADPALESSDRARLKVILVALIFVACMGLLVPGLLSPGPPAARADPPATNTPQPVDCRLGYTYDTGTMFKPDEMIMRGLRAGVFVDFTGAAVVLPPQGNTGGHPFVITPATPPHNVMTPQWAGLQHVLIVRMHQDVTWPDGPYCWNNPPLPTPDDFRTPGWFLYAAPTQQADIDYSLQQYQGALWLIGNEIDHPDLRVMTPPGPSGTPPAVAPHGCVHQDMMWPGTYAQAYHYWYYYIKSYDPSALVAPGGVVQWSYLREDYWNHVLEFYQRYYGDEGPMPIDWWNVHNYMAAEIDWTPTCQTPAPGATSVCPAGDIGYPPGVTPTASPTRREPNRTDFAEFTRQLTEFRKWLKHNPYHDYSDKPVIVSEFGALTPGVGPTPSVEMMLNTMRWMQTAVDPETGYPYDGYHLVQRWVFWTGDIGVEYLPSPTPLTTPTATGTLSPTPTNPTPTNTPTRTTTATPTPWVANYYGLLSRPTYMYQLSPLPTQHLATPLGVAWATEVSAANPSAHAHAWPCQIGQPMSLVPVLYLHGPSGSVLGGGAYPPPPAQGTPGSPDTPTPHAYPPPGPTATPPAASTPPPYP